MNYRLIYFFLGCFLFATALEAKTVFDSPTAKQKTNDLVEELRREHHEYALKSFEYELQNIHKLLKMRMKFADDFKSFLDSIEITDKKKFNQVLKEYAKLTKEFKKTVQRRQKFYEKDLVKPQEKVFANKIKDLISDIKKESSKWRTKVGQ